MSGQRVRSEHGPGVLWLADRAGCPPEELLADPRQLASALSEAGTAMTDLAAGLGSADAADRAAAERTADELRARFAGAPDPGVRFRARLTQALRDAADRVRPDPPAG